MDYKIFWTEESIKNLKEIIDYLNLKWTEKEIKNFKIKLSKKIELISTNPFMFPASVNAPKL